jgi:hypothetical protein
MVNAFTVGFLLQGESGQARNAPFQNSELQLSMAALQALAIETLPDAGLSVFRRPEIEADLRFFRDFEAVAAPLKGDPFYQTAIQEWEQVLASPLSPVLLLEEALGGDWEELPANPENIVEHLVRVIEEEGADT